MVDYSDETWRKMSRLVRLQEPRCYACSAPSTSADHIIPVSEAPEKFFDRSNLRGSCSKHNQGRVMPRMAAMAAINRRPAETREW